ncbi:MAG: hypothetical protein AB7G05_13370 [Hyphomonadaceae bacterium]
MSTQADVSANANAGVVAEAPEAAVLPDEVPEAQASVEGDADVVGSADVATEGVTQVDPSAPIEEPRATAQADIGAAADAGVEAPVTPSISTGVQTAAAPQAMSAGQVCQARTTSVHFGRSNVLSRQNRDAIEQAIDQASACNLEGVTIAAAPGAERRAGAVRALLERQGVPAEQIQVEESAEVAADTGETQVRMAFAGVANTNSGAALEPTQDGVNAAATQTASLETAAVVQGQTTPAPRVEAAPAPSVGAEAAAEAETQAAPDDMVDGDSEVDEEPNQ